MPLCSKTSRPNLRLESAEEKDGERREDELALVWCGEGSLREAWHCTGASPLFNLQFVCFIVCCLALLKEKWSWVRQQEAPNTCQTGWGPGQKRQHLKRPARQQHSHLRFPASCSCWFMTRGQAAVRVRGKNTEERSTRSTNGNSDNTQWRTPKVPAGL